jgi:uncharacterized protein YoxC
MKKFCFGLIVLIIISCNKQVDYSKDIKELKSQISLLQGQIGGLRKTTDSLTNELKGINTQVNDMSRKVDSIINRITIINLQIIELNSQLVKNNTDITSIIKKIEDLQTELINLTKLIQDLKTQQVATFGYEIISVDPRLKSNGKGVINVPVVIVNYLPTSDGIYLDRWKTYDSRVVKQQKDILTLKRANEKILSEKIIEKLSIEEGSRFRDYGKNITRPYVNINVVAYINVYDVKLIKIGTKIIDTTTNDSDDGIDNPVTIDRHFIDFNDLFNRVDIKNYVNNMGVKEVWFTSFTKEVGSNSYNVFESSMSPSINSSNTANISNGGGDLKDLPRFNSTYIVYGFNGWRGVDTDLHNRGHQLERQLEYVDYEKIYYGNFAKDRNTIGGYTHTPVNTVQQYDYNNTSLVSSDITTWKPSRGIGIPTNNLSWLNITYTFSGQMIAPNSFATGNDDWNKNAEVKWHIYWWQSLPGYNNNIEDNGKKVTNWWDIFYNWDDAVRSRKKLIE